MGEAVVDGQENIQFASEYLIKNIDKEKVYALYEEALKCAGSVFARNNIRMMRMVFRYSDLEVMSEKLDVPGPSTISKAADTTGEIWYVHENFGSYLIDQEGHAIAFAVKKRSDATFVPNDKWYDFE